MRALFICLLSIFASCNAFATTQTPDLLLIGQKEHYVHGIQLPQKARERLDKWKKKDGLQGELSSNWAGFYAKMRLSGGTLYVEVLEVYSDAGPRRRASVPLRLIFGSGGPVNARWFSGELDENLGRRFWYGPESYRARVFTFAEGRLIKTEIKKVR